CLDGRKYFECKYYSEWTTAWTLITG
ncbi:MAG: hypothetical protein JWQ91_732, partial [Aeromicrobium sp.]|nr:hypothetical protein [Aeromicrobium sp.]